MTQRVLTLPPHKVEVFWSRVDKTTSTIGCWIWTKGRTPFGYGRIGFGQSVLLAHRLAYEMLVGPIPKGMCVCHRCDNPPCVNPEHLWLATTAENTADKVLKGRQVVGDMHHNSKITEDDARSIVRLSQMGVKGVDLATTYRVSEPTICSILKGHTWAHATGVKAVQE